MKFKNCPYCHSEIYADATHCVNCNNQLWVQKSGDQCSVCGEKKSNLVCFHSTIYCQECALKESEEKIIVTTTNQIDGSRVKKYIGIESVEIVIGTGVFSEFQGDIADMFGQRSTAFEGKLQNAKTAALKRLKLIAFQNEANAIIGIDLDYTEFSSNRIGVIVNGTLVELEKM